VNAGTISYYRVNRATGYAEPFLPPDGRLPFSLDVPKALYSGMPAVLLATGEPGTTYEIHTNIGTLPPTVIGPTYMSEQTIDTRGLGGTVAFTAVYVTKPGGPRVALDLTQTPSASRAPLTTQVLPGPLPAYSNAELYTKVLRNLDLVTAWGAGSSWGVSEY